VLNDKGDAVTRTEYKPYGETWIQEGDKTNRPKFNSQELDPETGYYFYNARYYEAEIGRFITADNVIDGEYSTQGWNRFSYVKNNPVRYKDPSEHSQKDAEAQALASVGQITERHQINITKGGAGTLPDNFEEMRNGQMSEKEIATVKRFIGEGINGKNIDLKKLKVQYRGNPSDDGVGFSPPFGNSLIIQDINNKKGEIYSITALCHEVFHKMQYKEDPSKKIKVLAEFALHKSGFSDPYEYKKNTSNPIKKLSDINEVEGQAKYVGDFVRSVLNYEKMKTIYEEDVKNGFKKGMEMNGSDMEKYKAEAIERATVLKNSGMKSYEIDRFSGGKP